MPTIVDALVVSLALDATAFTKAQREAADSFKKTGDEAVKTGKKVEAAAKSTTERLLKLRSAYLDMAAVFLGGTALKDFIQDAVSANNAVGRLSTGLGTSPEFISAWNIAARRMGGSASATMGSIQALSDSLVDLRTKGILPPIDLFILGAQGKTDIDISHGWEKLAISLAKASHELAKTDPAAANRFLRSLGLDPVTAALLIRQGPRMAKYIAEMKRLAPSKADAEAAERLTDAQGKLGAAWDLLATKLMTALGPALEWFFDKIEKGVEYVAKWIDENPKLAAGITAVLAILAGTTAAAGIAAVIGLSAALAGLGGISLAGLLATLGAVAAAGAGALGIAYGVGAFDGDGKPSPLVGNDAIRRRGRMASDIALGKSGKLSDNQKEAYAAARQEGLSETAARALVANMSGEGLAHDAHRVHWDRSHNAHGIVQWDDDRSATIKAHYGKSPEEMSVADQTRAAIWEMKTNPRFSKTWRAMQGNNAGDMIDALVRNYEGPADKGRAIAERSRIYGGLGGLSVGARTSAALNNISNTHNATTSSSSNEMHINGGVHVNAPNATDANGIASGIDSALAARMFANHANYGPN